MLKAFTKLFGTKSERTLKGLQPRVKAINAHFDKLQALDNDALRQHTEQLKALIQQRLQPIDDEINTLNQAADTTEDLEKKDAQFQRIDQLEKDRNKKLEAILDEILPQAFAIVKETARRFATNEVLEVTARDYDRSWAEEHDFVSIEGDKAHWHNQWTAAGNKITWNMVHYDVQLVGGMILHQGKVAEMATGEGKTLVTTLPAFLNALAGRGVHVVTVNDYLAKRDMEWNRPIYAFHGFSVACIDLTPAHSAERRAAYRADIVHGTNNEFGFDYLRDNMVDTPDELVQGKHHFAMVDEVDSVLIDDARTPLIISGPAASSNEQAYFDLRPRVQKLYEAQRQVVTQFLQEAKQLLKEDDKKKKEEGSLALFRAYRGLPKYKPLIKFLSETGIRNILQEIEGYYLQDNGRMMPEADEPLFFTIDERNNNIDLTDKGINHLTAKDEDAQFFVLPDVATGIGKIEQNEDINEEQRQAELEALSQEYSLKNQRIHTTIQLLKAFALFEKDVEYIIVNDQIKLVDEQTGRVLSGRRYSDGLHQAIEAKEQVHIQRATQTYATVTLQNYFRMYHKLAGMTGTAETEAGELWEIYKLDVVVAPTNRPIIRDDRDDKVYRTVREKFNAVIDEIVELTKAGRPVLAGTTSVEMSELLSRMLSMRKIPHEVLNAKHHQREAEIVAAAGQIGAVTIATNMAGRGTDIKLSPEALAAGGLAIIGTERHESRRVDRQLRGRAGRQGDPGSSQFFISLEDSLMRLFGSDRIARIMDKLGLEEGEVIQHRMVTNSIGRAQRKVEENNFSYRKRLLEYDDVMNIQREVIYKRRRHALFGERLSLDVMNMLYATVEQLSKDAKDSTSFELLRTNLLRVLGTIPEVDKAAFQKESTDKLAYRLYEGAIQHYQAKEASLAKLLQPQVDALLGQGDAPPEQISVPVSDGQQRQHVLLDLKQYHSNAAKGVTTAIEKSTTLLFIDQYWKEHLQEMDQLRQSVQNAVYEQKDPLLVYKFESFQLFKNFLNKINQAIVSYLFHAKIDSTEGPSTETTVAPSHYQDVMEHHLTPEEATEEEGGPSAPPPPQPARAEKIPHRNQRVTVQYSDGSIQENVKFKTVEGDLKQGNCILLGVEEDA